MRDSPIPIDAVAVKSTADVISDTTGGQAVERTDKHPPGFGPRCVQRRLAIHSMDQEKQIRRALEEVMK